MKTYLYKIIIILFFSIQALAFGAFQSSDMSTGFTDKNSEKQIEQKIEFDKKKDVEKDNNNIICNIFYLLLFILFCFIIGVSIYFLLLFKNFSNDVKEILKNCNNSSNKKISLDKIKKEISDFSKLFDNIKFFIAFPELISILTNIENEFKNVVQETKKINEIDVSKNINNEISESIINNFEDKQSVLITQINEKYKKLEDKIDNLNNTFDENFRNKLNEVLELTKEMDGMKKFFDFTNNI